MRAPGPIFAALLVGLIAGPAAAETLSGQPAPARFNVRSFDGTRSYVLSGQAAEGLNCFALDMAYFEQAEAFTVDSDHQAMRAAASQRRLEWQRVIARLPDGGRDIPSAELRHAAASLKAHWRETARTMAQLSVLDMPESELSEPYASVLQRFGACATLLQRLDQEG